MPSLDTNALIIVRDQLINHLQSLRKQEEEGELFETLTSINPLFVFFHNLLGEVNPPRGCSDPLLEFIFMQSNLYTETGFMFAVWASHHYREQILRRSLRCGSFSQIENLLILMGRRPTRKELRIIFDRTRGNQETNKKVLSLVQQHYPDMVGELTQKEKQEALC